MQICRRTLTQALTHMRIHLQMEWETHVTQTNATREFDLMEVLFNRNYCCLYSDPSRGRKTDSVLHSNQIIIFECKVHSILVDCVARIFRFQLLMSLSRLRAIDGHTSASNLQKLIVRPQIANFPQPKDLNRLLATQQIAIFQFATREMISARAKRKFTSYEYEIVVYLYVGIARVYMMPPYFWQTSNSDDAIRLRRNDGCVQWRATQRSINPYAQW